MKHLPENMGRNSFGRNEFEALFQSHFNDLMGYIFSYVRDREIARDIVHDAFLILWKNREAVDMSASPRSYLYALARNLALDFMRHRKVMAYNQGRLLMEMTRADEDTDDYPQNKERLRAYVAQLPEKQLAVLQKCFVEGKSYREIAAELDISLNTVKTHLKRAMEYLRRSVK